MWLTFLIGLLFGWSGPAPTRVFVCQSGKTPLSAPSACEALPVKTLRFWVRLP